MKTPLQIVQKRNEILAKLKENRKTDIKHRDKIDEYCLMAEINILEWCLI